jgi:putative ABC transport system permease protein
MLSFIQDVRNAARSLRRNPLFALSTAGTLALGIGVVTGLFAIVNAVLLTPLAPHHDAIVRVWKLDPQGSIDRYPISYPEFEQWRASARSFRSLAAVRYAETSSVALSVGPASLPVVLAPVSADFFDVLHGGAPLVGRWFGAADEGNETELAAVVSERFWRRVGGGDPSFLGRRLRWPGGARALIVVGVAPDNLRYPVDADAWVPIAGYFKAKTGNPNMDLHSRRFADFHLVGRLMPGIPLEQARAELDSISRGFTAQFPDDVRAMRVVAEPVLHASLGTLRPLTWFLFAGAALVFLAAGGNVAAMLVMRAATQAREIAVRVALGAGRGQIARERLAESLLLGGAGWLGGLLVAQLVLVIGNLIVASTVPRLDLAAIDLTGLAFCGAVTLAWVVIFGSTPLWRRTVDSAPLSRQLSTRSTRSQVMLRAMVVAQVSAAVVVATAAGLLVRSFLNLGAVDRGFDSDKLAVVRMFLPDEQYDTATARLQFFTRLLTRLATHPGVISATAVHTEPGSGQSGLSARMMFEGQQPDAARQNPYGTWEPVLPSYFDTMRIRITKGRAFTEADDATRAPVAIVSEAVAQRYWPGQDPIGKRVQFTTGSRWATVVGVAADTRYRQLTRDWLTTYFPARQFFFFAPTAVVVRTAGDPIAAFPDLGRAVRAEEPAAAVHSIETMAKLLADETSRQRTAVAIAVLFSLIAIVVAALGVYAAFSYELTQRGRELAVHAAVGATPVQLLQLTLRQSILLGAIGAVIGLTAASGLTGLLNTLLFNVTSLDLMTFVVAGAMLMTIVILASLVPARRAMRVDPISLLRSE